MFDNESIPSRVYLLCARLFRGVSPAHSVALIVSILVMGFCSSITKAESCNADSVLKRIYGLDVFPDTSQTLHSYSFEGTVEHAGLSGVFTTFYDKESGYVSLTDMGFFSVSQGFDRFGGWEVNTNGIVKDISRIGEDLLVLIRSIESREYLSASQSTLIRTCLGPSRFNDKGVYQFRLVFDKGISGDVFIDSLNGQVLGMQMKYDLADAEVVFSDFREVDGVSFAFHSELTANLSELNMVTQTTSCKVNNPIPVETFIRPKTITTNVSFPADTDSLVTELEYYRGHLYFRMSINGSDSRLFLLDSGAGGIVVDAFHAESLGIEPVGSQSGLGVAGSADFSFGIVKEMNVAGMILKNQFVSVLDLGLGMRNTFRGIVGIIGYELLSHAIVSVDYQRQLMTIFPPDADLVTGAASINAVVPMRYYATLPTVVAGVNGKTGDFLIDIGSRYGPVLHEYFVKTNSFEDLPERSDPNDNGYIGGVGGSLPTRTITLANFDIDALKFKDQPAWAILGSAGASASTALAGNIGNGFLDQFRVTFDYPHMRIILQDPMPD